MAVSYPVTFLLFRIILDTVDIHVGGEGRANPKPELLSWHLPEFRHGCDLPACV